MVRKNTHRRIHDDGRDTSNHKNTARHSTIKAEDVCIELQLEDHHHLEHQISGGISQRVADFLS
jgi:ABC-type lipoprotein export system ATPase subunit